MSDLSNSIELLKAKIKILKDEFIRKKEECLNRRETYVKQANLALQGLGLIALGSLFNPVSFFVLVSILL